MQAPKPFPVVPTEVPEPALTGRPARDARALAVLFEISQILKEDSDLGEVGEPVLAAIARHTGMRRGTLSLLDAATGTVSAVSAFGLSPDEVFAQRDRLGEGLAGLVVKSGQPVVLRRGQKRPEVFDLDKTPRLLRADVASLAVPISSHGGAIGALRVDRTEVTAGLLAEDVRLLSVATSMIAQIAQVQRVILETRTLAEENARLHGELRARFSPANILGRAKSMQAVYDLIAQVSPSETTVLITGESGVGKELVAHAIHYGSPRADGPFVKVNCAALPDTLLESELFGHEKGAFTGAVSTRKGRFELAHGGTLFLDEVGDFSPMAQIKLLRALQERQFERVGGTRTLSVDVRVIAATNRDLESLVADDSYRRDLYYRLNVFPIHVPPLRERKTDILLLADHFVEKYARANGKAVRRISTPAIDLLMAYHWPGNVRELENTIERAVLLARDDVIRTSHLPPTLQSAESTGHPAQDLQGQLDALERELIIEALKASRGNRAKAARELGLTERQMGLRVDKLGLDIKRFKAPRRGATGAGA